MALSSHIEANENIDPEVDFLVELNIPSQIDIVRLVVDLGTALMELRGYESADRDAIRLAIHETLINAVVYGTHTNPDARVSVKFYFKETCFYTDILDEGEGYDLEEIPDPTLPENLLRDGGRGIFLAKQLTDNFNVEKLPNHKFRVSFCRRKKA